MRPLLNLTDNQPLLFLGQWFPRPSGAGRRGAGWALTFKVWGWGFISVLSGATTKHPKTGSPIFVLGRALLGGEGHFSPLPRNV